MNWHLFGGTRAFQTFAFSLLENVSLYASVEDMPFSTASGDGFILLPEYDKGVNCIPEQDFNLVENMMKCASSNAMYIENYMAQDYFNAKLTGANVAGRERYLHQEYIQYDGRILQARSSFYLPAFNRSGNEPLAFVTDCIGTHKISFPSKHSYPVLFQCAETGVYSATFPFSKIDMLYMRPYSEWREFFATFFARLANVPIKKTSACFEKSFPEILRLSHTKDAMECVRKAIAWHQNSGMLRTPDGSRGMYEMIRSNNLGIRSNLRTDSTLITGALFACAGQIFKDSNLERIGCNLVDYMLERGIQSSDGYYRWFDHTTMVYASDMSRSGLAVINMYKTTGEKRYLDSAQKAGDALLSWLGKECICCGNFKLENGYAGRSLNDNPVFYGEMVSFLLQMHADKYTEAAIGVVRRICDAFPKVQPFGFSDNFTFSRFLLMLACLQAQTDEDCSAQINTTLSFFEKLQTECGGIAETPIRLIDHTEAGIAIGDGSDSIADMLYCNNYVFIALSVLKKLIPGHIKGIDMAQVQRMYAKLRNFITAIQIYSDNPKFNGGWMRAFDMKLGEYYGLDKDQDWGSYCIMAGWVTGFIPLVLLYEDSPDSFFVDNIQESIS